MKYEININTIYNIFLQTSDNEEIIFEYILKYCKVKISLQCFQSSKGHKPELYWSTIKSGSFYSAGL